MSVRWDVYYSIRIRAFFIPPKPKTFADVNELCQQGVSLVDAIGMVADERFPSMEIKKEQFMSSKRKKLSLRPDNELLYALINPEPNFKPKEKESLGLKFKRFKDSKAFSLLAIIADPFSLLAW
jgi:hypothetical protein